MTARCDYLIIGGGIVGLSMGLELLKKYPNSKVLLVDKENLAGQHASGRNSGVLHAGFYYSPESLKAKFCLQGNRELKELIASESIEISNCGKVVVAKDDEDLIRLEDLYNRGIANGVEIELLEEQELKNIEPLAKTHKRFLWSPSTAVSDPIKVTNAIEKRFLALGGQVLTNSIAQMTNDGELLINGERIDSGIIINSAGSGAIHLAHKVGVGNEYSQLPVLGLYKVTPNSSLPLTRLVYPVPNPKNPFLGVHFTLTVDGSVKIGPTAIPILGREQYSLKDLPKMQDILSSFSSLFAMFKDSPSDLFRLASTELPKMSLKILTDSGSLLVPTANSNVKWHSKRPGIRAQLVNLETGKFELDYVVRKHRNQIHILNAVSPGWTSALPFSRWIISEFL